MNSNSSQVWRIAASTPKQALLIAFVAFVSYAYFYEGGGWNQNTRFDLVRAIVERGTLKIDGYHENTGDKAMKDGHYYTDKAPGQPLLAVPAAVATRGMMKAAGMNAMSASRLVAMSYVCTLFSVALPTALACACLFLIGLQLGAGVNAAAFGALAMGLGTPIWPYATLMWGHALAASCLLFGFAAALKLNHSETGEDVWWGVAVGVTAGWATVTEYQAAPASAMLALFAIARVWPDGWPRRLRVATGIAAGALPCVATLMLYLHFAFGSALHPSYKYVVGPFPWVSQGYFGLKYPRIDVAFKLLFGLKRGIFILAPVTIVAPFGLRLLQKRPSTRLAGFAAAAIFVYYLLLNASYAEWTAGLSYGPRIMGAGIPALCVGLAPAWEHFQRRGRSVLLTLLFVSVLFSLMGVSTTPQPPFDSKYPITQVFWPAFWRGHLALEQISMLAPADGDARGAHGAFNLGQLVGLRGLASLLPLLAIWLMAGLAWSRMKATEDTATGTTGGFKLHCR
jgi:hypothetical protein